MSDPQAQFKRPLLYCLVASVALGTLLGIAIVLRGKWGWFEIRVILTTLTVAVASLCGLACDLSRTPRGANLLPRGGLVLTFFSAVMILLAVWVEIDAEWYWKSTACISIVAIATVHVCLLSIARLAGRFAWVYFIACQVIFGLALLLCVMIVWEIDQDALFRLVVALAIVAAGMTLVIPLLHRISKSESPSAAVLPLNERNLAAIDAEITLLRKRIAELEQLRAQVAGESP